MMPTQNSPLTQDSPTQESIQTWLVGQLSQQLGIDADEVDVEARLDSFGLDSARALGMMSQAEKELGFQVSPILLWHYPTIASLSERLLEECEESETIEI